MTPDPRATHNPGAGAGSAAPAPLSKAATFWRRLSSSTVLWSVVLLVIFSPYKLLADVLFAIAMGVLVWLGSKEFYGLVARRGLACFPGAGLAGGLVLSLVTFAALSGGAGAWKPSTPGDAALLETAVLGWVVVALCMRQVFQPGPPTGLVGLGTTLLGVLYVAWLLNFLPKIAYYPFADPRSGRFYVLYFIAITKFSDLGAYAVGSLIGRHKMIPRVSPGKTWEGFGGAIFCSVVMSFLLLWLGGNRLEGMTWLHALILGVLLSAAAVVGDLIESLFKREAGAKDSGAFFPGIGGILDLLDSLLFNGPLMYFYLHYVLMAQAR